MGLGRFAASEAATPAASGRYADAWPALDRFVEQYMRDMNSPGMTLVLADRDAVQRVVTYGFGDLEARQKVGEGELFQIGSISKSFVALSLLQLRDEGKLDFDRPVAEYLPWLRVQSSFAPITVHHLLTHSSGLPGAGDVFQADPELRHLAAYAPGEHFHYNNAMYDVLRHPRLGRDGRELPEVIRERIFRPLGMNDSEPVITMDVRARIAKNYAPFLSDRPYPRHGRLCEAPAIIATGGAGCVASTARDMGAYVRMIANHGAADGARIVSEDGFKRFSSPQILAEDFGPGAHYGYGIAVDTLDGNRLVRHTGGMVSFMSSLMVDIDEGIGGFASVNAQQGYRPNPVVKYAIQLMRARRKGAPAPASPEPDVPAVVTNAAEFRRVVSRRQGRPRSRHRRRPAFRDARGTACAARAARGGRPLYRQASRARPFRFCLRPQGCGGRGQRRRGSQLGRRLVPNAKYAGPERFDYPKGLGRLRRALPQREPLDRQLPIVVNKGRLMMDGSIPLEADGDLFRLRDDPYNTEWIRFGEVVNGKCMHLRLSGSDLWRVTAA
jgi:CubicO group peptidase (beta-lactamase class C family)